MQGYIRSKSITERKYFIPASQSTFPGGRPEILGSSPVAACAGTVPTPVSGPVSQPRLLSSLPIPSLSVKVTLVESRHWHWNIWDHVKISEIVNCVYISMETRNWNIQLWHKQCYKMFYKIETLFYTFAFLSGKKWTQDPSQLFLFSLSKRIFEGSEQNKFCWRKKWNLKAMSISL